VRVGLGGPRSRGAAEHRQNAIHFWFYAFFNQSRRAFNLVAQAGPQPYSLAQEAKSTA
jgi:hypothetical protein